MPPKKDSEGEVVIQEVIDFNILTKFIKRYDGSSIPLYEFIDDCENALILASESQRKILLNYIVSQITGSARIIISNINTRDFNSIKEALVRNYSPHKNYSTLLLELQQLKQRHDEDVTKFMNRIQTATNSLIKSIKNCNIKSKADEFNGQIKLIDELSLQRMIHGNKCQQTRIVFYSTHPKTLLDAYKTALEIETDTARNKNCNICGREGHSSNTCFKNKDSSISESIGSIHLNLEFAHHKVYIMKDDEIDTTYDGIIGADFFEINQAEICYKTNKLIINETIKIDLLNNNKDNEDDEILNNYIVKPRTETITKVEITNPEIIKSEIIDDELNQEGVYLVNANENNETLCTTLNTTDQQLRIDNLKVEFKPISISTEINNFENETKQEQPLRGHFEHQESENRGNYIELLYLLSESDIKLKTHLDNSTVFTGLSNHIQNDLVSAISKVLLDEIKTEIRASKFVSIIVDESTDISRKAQLSTIFRYVDENNEIQERFVGFVDVSPNRTANALFQHIRETLEEFGCLDKLIAQTYDGAAVMSGEHNGVQRKIRDICPNSLFVHCYAHRLNLVLSQSVKHISGCKRFFSRMLSFSTFFCKSSRRISLLDCQIKKRFPTAAPTRWNYNSKILNMILEYQTELMEIFNQIINDEDEWDTDAVINAEVLHRYLKEFEFNFNLHLFSAIFNSADFLFEILQKKTFDISYCVSEIKKFVKYLDNKKDDFDSLWNKVITKNFNRKRKYAECEEDVKTTYKLHYSEILETLSVNTTNRFRDIENLKFLEFFNVKKFKEYENNFPDFLFKSLHLTYGKYFDFMKLKSELIYMYSTQDFHLKSINDVKELIVKDDLIDVLEQVFSLIQLICTIPSTSASAERSFSTMKRIKTFTRSSQSEERLSGLALIAIEKKIMSNLKNNKKFYDAVIDEFCKKERRIKLNFKK
ncbi:zinc finger MYM-type protein 1-like [Arctopsyche grandis]|uniref:zinc finger MYM-type protein 1-like n=1 Tax=Arctopsyche grandis TaxID=121162 RepID=UPI00406D94B7